MRLMRDDMRSLFTKINNAHAGLLIQRGLTDWEDGEKPIKQKLINTIASVTPTELYKLAFERWLVNTYDAESEQSNQNFAHVSGQVVGRLYTGLALGGTLETGVMTHHTYGLPMIAGSSVKGAVRNYAELLFAKRDELGNPILKTDNKEDKDSKSIQRIEIDPDKQPIIDVLFGTGDENSSTDSPDNAGYIIWHDAWWIPPVGNDGKLKTGNDSKPFVEEIVTVHHQKYYNGELTQALDMENPVPNQQLAVQGGFYFTIEGNGETEEGKKWLKLAQELLTATIENQGLGAKSSSGYGYFELNDELESEMEKRYQAGSIVNDPNDEFSTLRNAIILMDESKLIESLSKGKNKFFKKYNLDKENEEHLKVIASIVNEQCATWRNWEDSGSGNAKKAFNFISKNLSE